MAMAVCSSTMGFLFVMFLGFLCSSHAHNHMFYVGWTLMPSESYDHWAEKSRFQVNDELVFKYEEGHDSVLVVTEDDYFKCNKDKPIRVFKAGVTRFKFDRSGPFFFISGHDQNCEKGQKFVIVVLSNHHQNTTHNPLEAPLRPPSSSPSPSPSADSVPEVNPPAHSPSPSPAAKSPAPAPPVKSPSHSPSPSPSPVAAETPNYAPPDQTPSHSTTPSSRGEAPVPSDHYALPPLGHSPVFSPHHAPAPAPSSASDLGCSFILIAGLSLVPTLISAGLV